MLSGKPCSAAKYICDNQIISVSVCLVILYMSLLPPLPENQPPDRITMESSLYISRHTYTPLGISIGQVNWFSSLVIYSKKKKTDSLSVIYIPYSI